MHFHRSIDNNLLLSFKLQSALRRVFAHESLAYVQAHDADGAASAFARDGPGLSSCPVHSSHACSNPFFDGSEARGSVGVEHQQKASEPVSSTFESARFEQIGIHVGRLLLRRALFSLHRFPRPSGHGLDSSVLDLDFHAQVQCVLDTPSVAGEFLLSRLGELGNDGDELSVLLCSSVSLLQSSSFLISRIPTIAFNKQSSTRFTESGNCRSIVSRSDPHSSLKRSTCG